MNGVHDMGGMHGFGPVERDPNERGFHSEWEGRACAMNRLSRAHGYYNIDESRFGIEVMDPAHYLRAPYFERWLATTEYNLIKKGFLTADEIEARVELLREQPGAVFSPPAAHSSPPLPEKEAPDEPVTMPAEPRFAVGDSVVTRNEHPTHHTRLPRYARGKRGTIHQIHGPQIFPDTNAHGHGENPQVLYNVRFDGEELWGASAEPGQSLYLDLWESYLEPVAAPERI